MSTTELNAFTDAQLRTIYALIRAFVCNSAEEMAEFDADNTWHVETPTQVYLNMRRPVAFTMMAIDELRASFTKTTRHESPETMEWSSMEHTTSNVLDAEGFKFTLNGFIQAAA